MNIARAAKGAASLLMVFGLVALVACQAGPAGTTGAKGDKGDPGAAGAPGAPGPAALQAIGDPDDSYIILINNGGTDAVPTIGDVTKPSTSANATALFNGGVAPVTYTISAVTGNPFMASIKDGVIVVTKRSGAAGNLVAAAYSAGTTATVRATDANGATATKNIAIRANRKPTVQGDEMHARRNVIVGTQSEDMGPASDPDLYKAKNVATIMDLRSWVAAASAPAQPNPYFWDDGAGAGDRDIDLRDHTFEITKIERGAADAGNAADHLTVELVAGENGLAANGIKLTGLKSTWDTSLNPDAHLPVVITLKATDPGGLSNETTIKVSVDGAPEVNTPPPASAVTKATGVQKVLIRNLDDFFKDPEQAAGAGLLVASGDIVVTPSTGGAAAIDSGNLALTPNNPGTTTVSYILRSNPIPATGTYLANNRLDRDGDGESDTGTAVTPGPQAVRGTMTVTITPN